MGRKHRFNPYTLSVVTSTLTLPAVLIWGSTKSTAAPEPTRAELAKQFNTTVRPFLQSYCTPCHGKDKPEAQLNLAAYATIDSVIKDLPHWTLVMERLHAKDMPPAEMSSQPTAKQRNAVMAWIQAVRQSEIQRTAGDPGPVLARRLSNAEYDYTIRDLTGVDLRPTKTFPVDPANQEGFDNSGESLTFSSALAKKYFAAAKDISEHMVLTSTGLTFASHPVVGETDRDKFNTLRIVDFYHRQPTDFADYFYAAWRYRHRVALGAPDATLETVAAETKVSPKYLDLVWKTLSSTEIAVGPVARLQKDFNALPAPGTDPETVKKECVKLRNWVSGLRRRIAWQFRNLRVPEEFSTGSQCNILWKDRQYASHRRKFNPAKLQIGGVPETRVIPARDDQPEKKVTAPVDPDLFAPLDEAARAPYLASFAQFADVFPDAFYIDERGLMEFEGGIYAREGRLLTAGSHNAMGYFRDDTPLMEMILDDKGKQELDTLWRDFSIVASIYERMHLQFLFYERNEARTILQERDPEFNFAKSEDKANASDERIKRFAELYIAKAKRKGVLPETLAVYEEHFKITSANIRREEADRAAAEPVQLKAMLNFARRAYRRPLTVAEQNGLLTFYKTLRQKEGLTHEDAIRDCVASILISPNFLFRVDLDASAEPSAMSGGLQNVALTQRRTTVTKAAPSQAPPKKTQPLSDYALANRLSYFLWSSMPDDELLAHAAAGDLHKPAVLTAQTQRMLKDPRVRALAVEFGGNWLDFRRFEEHSAVDRMRFPSFDDSLRLAMFEEPIHFMADTFQNNGSVLDWLYGKHTFVNGPLAKHYGMEDVKVAKDSWVRVDNADSYGRGGLLPMAAFLTKNASGLRTSPVRRGYWVVRRLLGEQIPPPPAVVPELPKDEHELGDRTLRQALEQHRKNPACAGCHARFDSYGLVFENFGPIGERRTADGGGKPVDSRAPFPGNQEFAGVSGLQTFIKQRRQQDFLDTFSRKLLSYSLGRTTLPSDEPLLQETQKRLAARGYRFNVLVEAIVTSPQFRNRRTPVTSTKDTI